MEPLLWDRIQEIYYSALPIVPTERDEFVERACGCNPELVREVSSLLKADESSGDFLESPAFEVGLKIISGNKAKNAEASSRSLADELIGTTIEGRYLVEKELSHGGMGTVYLARDVKLHNRPIVIKVLLQVSLQDPYVVKKFKQEVEALARIDHPGVVNVLGAGELADGKPYIGMQFVNGVSLRSQITSEGMNFERAASILKQIGAALEDVHEKGIYHRDLKPENIMLQALRGGTELVKIVDFGIAKVKDSVVAPSTVNQAPVGTVLYMSPEQLRGEKVTASSDIYSMAVTAYEMVTGRRPFNPTSAPQLLEMHRAGARVKPIDLRSDLSTEAQAIILRALSFDRLDRYQNAGEFADALARALSSEQENPGLGNQRVNGSSRPKRPSDSSRDVLLSTHHPRWDTPQMPSPVAGAFSTNPVVSQVRKSKVVPTWAMVVGICLLVAVAIAGSIGIYMYRSNRQVTGPVAASTQNQRAFTYWLTVQKMRDGRNYQDPFQSSGQEIFESGYKFRLNVSSPEPGFLYVLNEGPPDEDGTTFTLIYPTPLRKNAFVSNEPVNTNWNTFGGRAGTENLWIVWSASSISQLESAKAEAFNNRRGAVANPDSIRAVREFLTKYSEPKPKSTKDATVNQTHVIGDGDVVVKLAQLEHR
jgi:serine/threonine protein kinase